MLSKIKSGAISGVDGFIVEIEVDISSGLANFFLVGLPDSAVKESRERVRAALKNSGFEYPIKTITVNLAPADVKKEGAAYDLPIALGILSSSSQIDPKGSRGFFVAGELSLDGEVRPINGVLPLVFGARAAGVTKFIVPYENAAEAALVDGTEVYGVKTLKEAAELLNGESGIMPVKLDAKALFERRRRTNEILDFADIKGQENVKRALLIAAAGAHNVLLSGPPGTGKTMAAKRLASIMPELSFEESVECVKIYSVAGLLRNGENKGLFAARPFRSPHHTLSQSAMTGGGKFPKPGEISLSHNGVLFLDELPEFDKATLEALRQPLEDGEVVISRVNGTVKYPSRFMLVASMNPCPCGYYGDMSGKCKCRPSTVARYLSRVSGPLLDRIDIMAEAARVEYDKLKGGGGGGGGGTTSARMREIVEKARSVQAERNGKGVYNAALSAKQTESFCALDQKGEAAMKKAFDNIGLSARAYSKILKIARTIADMDGSEKISADNVAEAVQYRLLDKKFAQLKGMAN